MIKVLHEAAETRKIAPSQVCFAMSKLEKQKISVSVAAESLAVLLSPEAWSQRMCSPARLKAGHNNLVEMLLPAGDGNWFSQQVRHSFMSI